jgi:hypothetical protein
LAAAVLAWCLLAAFSTFLEALRRNPDPMVELQAEFMPFARVLPPRGEVGYLEQRDANDEAVRMYYAAQYALAPRLVVSRIGPEFLIVARGTPQPGGDARLEGYYHVLTFPGGHRLFRRRTE